jgi:hypothetical protein
LSGRLLFYKPPLSSWGAVACRLAAISQRPLIHLVSEFSQLMFAAAIATGFLFRYVFKDFDVHSLAQGPMIPTYEQQSLRRVLRIYGSP